MNDLPLCVACEHFVPVETPHDYGAYTYALCAIATKRDLVSGQVGLKFCSTERTSGTCGPHGTRFSAKVEAA
jgi:hypothetical protein